MRRTVVAVGALMAMAVCLRAPFTGVGSVSGEVAAGLGLTSGQMGLVTTLPLLSFAAVSSVVAAIERAIGAGRAMILGFAVLACGIAVRSVGGEWGLYAGSATVGAGIAVANVLAPAFVKRLFPGRVYQLTSAYLGVMTLFAGVSSGIAVPLATAWGWRGSLAVWAAAAAVAVVWWWPFRGERFGVSRAADATRAGDVEADVDVSRTGGSGGKGLVTNGSLARSPMAWCVALYMGTQSLLYYCFVAWFAPILQTHGLNADAAGYVSAAYVAIGLVGSLAVPLLARRFRNQSIVGVGLGAVYVVGMAALQVVDAPGALPVVVVCCGLCQGACVSFATAQFSVHASTTQAASALSGFAQSIGYAIAAVGPVALGLLFDAVGSWSVPNGALLTGALLLVVLGYFVGKPRMVG